MPRGWMEHPVFAGEVFSRAQAWCWLNERAAYRASKTLKRGQLRAPTSRAWQWSETSVRRYLKRLERAEMITI